MEKSSFGITLHDTSVNADPYIALCLACLVATITKRVQCKMSVLAYLGKHSMNIYLVHTFIFKYFFHDFIYGFHNSILMFAVLIVISLGISVVLEQIKRKLFFYELVGKITVKLSV